MEGNGTVCHTSGELALNYAYLSLVKCGGPLKGHIFAIQMNG